MKLKYLLPLLPALAVASCTSLPRPVATAPAAPQADALKLLTESSAAAGNPYQRFSRVEVDYDGEWSNFATKTQAILTDPEFRKSSSEIYFPKRGRITQIHRGPGGEKLVTRTRGGIEVVRNGEIVTDEEELQAAALVTDCYRVFTFGSSALLELGSGWTIIGQRSLNGERCTLIAGSMRPGFGLSEGDGVIAWIGDETKRLQRVQMSLLGLASTAGADIDVTFGDFQPGPQGTLWPRYFNERIRRPIDTQAHEWRMTSLDIR